MLTLNQRGHDCLPQPEEFKAILQCLGLDYGVFQLERVTTLHYQGYVELGQRRRASWIKRRTFEWIHLEVARATRDACRAYCMKEESRIEGPWEINHWVPASGQGHRSDLDAVVEAIESGHGMKELAASHPKSIILYSRGIRSLINLKSRPRTTAPRVLLFYGPPGCGKTRKAYEDDPDLWASPLSGGQWFDGYCGEKTALLDDYAGAKSGFSLTASLRLLDRYELQVPFKGGFIWWRPTTIVLTTNYHPREWFKWDEREPQYGALQRRFSAVLRWRSGSLGPELVEIPTGLAILGRPDPWASFWAGPELEQLASGYYRARGGYDW